MAAHPRLTPPLAEGTLLAQWRCVGLKCFDVSSNRPPVVALGAGLIDRLRLSKRFLEILRRGTWVRAGALSVGILRNGLPMNRVGLRVRKSVGNAVARNRVKRLLREAYRRAVPSLQSGHDILVVFNRAHAASLPTLQRAMQHAFEQIGLLKGRSSVGQS